MTLVIPKRRQTGASKSQAPVNKRVVVTFALPTICRSIYERIVNHDSTVTRETNSLQRINPSYTESNVWDIFRREVIRERDAAYRRGIDKGLELARQDGEMRGCSPRSYPPTLAA